MQSEETEGKFKGDKKLYKVSQEVQEGDITEFLKRKTNDNEEEFIVQDLNENKRLITFMVSSEYKFKDLFYNPTFWP